MGPHGHSSPQGQIFSLWFMFVLLSKWLTRELRDSLHAALVAC